MGKKLPDHIAGLIQYLSSTSEKANEDLVLKYFRKTFRNEFTRQEEADRSDGYVPGHFVLELKGQTNDWLSGLFQGIAYKKSLDFGIVIVVAKSFLAVWSLDDLGENLVDEVLKEKGAPSAIGKRLGSKYQKQRAQFLKKSAYQFPSEYLAGIFKGESSVLLKEVQSFEKILASRKKVRQKITTKNFTTVLKQMSEYFDSTKPIKVVRAFYSMIFGWNETSLLEVSSRNSNQAALGGEIIENLIPGKRNRFKKFVESHFIHLSDSENIDDFFAMYDQALDAVDPQFRIKNGIFFTDLNLSKFAMWFVKSKLGDIGKDYLVIDPACGSGNLVTNWKSPLELRHKVVSEIEPELLYTVEQRMKGDKWHDGKYTVVPKVQENKGLNFLDISAEEYIEVLKNYLSEKNQKPNKPLAFLCNPPYRSDDDQTAENISYKVHPSIIKMTGIEGSSERYACFLAQMKLICEQAADSGLPNESLLFLFTSATWLSKRPVFKEIRSEIFSDFTDVGGFLIRSNEFFDVKGSFPIAFTVWKYMGKNANLDSNRAIKLHDLTGIKGNELSEINWSDKEALNASCENILKNSQDAICGVERLKFDKNWIGFGRRNLYRNLTKNEKDSNSLVMGLPRNDSRHAKKTVYGHADGGSIGFLLDLTPVRTKMDDKLIDKPWFYLDSRFLRAKTNRIFSGLPDSRGYCVTDLESAKKLFSWYALSRTFHQIGYPLWVGAEEMWPVMAPKHLEDRLASISFAIGYAENDCVETMFPANNPVNGVGEIWVHNQLTPLNENSYWNQSLASFFDHKSANVEDLLVRKVDTIFNLWKRNFKNKTEIHVEYKKPYFVGSGVLRLGAGLEQIKDYAKELEDSELLIAFEEMNQALKKTKEEFHHLLHQKGGFNYFDTNKNFRKIKATEKELTKFEKVLERRRVAASFVINELSNDDSLGAVKLAKILYIADQECNLDLDAQYLKDVAGPMDGRMFYNSKVGLFPDQKSSSIGKIVEKTFKKNGEVKVFKKILPSSDTPKLAKNIEDVFGKKSALLKNIVKIFKPLSTDHSEAIATLYACWNDLIISQKKFSDEDIIKNFFKWSVKKKRFNEEDLKKTLRWMRSKKIIPQGKGRLIQKKSDHNTKSDVPF